MWINEKKWKKKLDFGQKLFKWKLQEKKTNKIKPALADRI